MDSSLENRYPLDELMPLIRESLDMGKTVKLSPRGTSMLPMLRQGRDQVRLAPVPGKLHPYDLPLYQREDGHYVLHRIVKAGDTYTCVGDNQFRLEPGLRQEQMIAVVTAVFRDGREIPVTSPGYWLYCRFWHYSRPVRYLWRRAKGWLRRSMP
jgi:hypothetical protein